jgi:hypothetical protein
VVCGVPENVAMGFVVCATGETDGDCEIGFIDPRGEFPDENPLNGIRSP